MDNRKALQVSATERQRLDQQREHLERKHSTERVDKLVEIITKARWAVDQPPPEGDEKIAMLAAWAEVLEVIPVEELNDAYLLASRAKRNGFPVNALEIIAAWNKDRGDKYLSNVLKGLVTFRGPDEW